MFFQSPSSSTISNHSDQVSDEEFMIFHTSDRQLFGRMVFAMGCDISDSMQVIAFWIWLERSTGKYLVEKMLTMSDLHIGSLINESLLCIKLAESEDVCYRAFHDIIQVAVSQLPCDRILIENPVVHGNEIPYPRDHLRGLDYNIKVGDLNWAFDDVIEALYMQDVSEEEQALYARLLVRDPKTMEEILGGRECKMKFSINGKHVWARKYVQKNSRALSFAPCSEAPRPADKSGA
ncbi:hypothetical protein AKJ16_DCAP26586 [Drosera capensis]